MSSMADPRPCPSFIRDVLPRVGHAPGPLVSSARLPVQPKPTPSTWVRPWSQAQESAAAGVVQPGSDAEPQAAPPHPHPGDHAEPLTVLACPKEDLEQLVSGGSGEQNRAGDQIRTQRNSFQGASSPAQSRTHYWNGMGRCQLWDGHM